MTPERAAYHRLMLLAGFREEYDRELDTALETEDPISSPLLDLALCMSDLNQTLSVLNNYTLSHAVDEQQVYDMILAELRRQYAQQLLTPARAANVMYTIAQNWDKGHRDPFDRLRYPSYQYDSVEEGYLSEEVFRIALEAFLFHGAHIDTWALEQERRKQKKKSFWNFFRK